MRHFRSVLSLQLRNQKHRSFPVVLFSSCSVYMKIYSIHSLASTFSCAEKVLAKYRQILSWHNLIKLNCDLERNESTKLKCHHIYILLYNITKQKSMFIDKILCFRLNIYLISHQTKGSYIRVGDGDKPMTEYEVYSYETFKMQIHDELRVSERADFSDIDTDKLNIFLAQIKEKKPNLANLSKEKICQLQGLTDKNEPTLAGIMLFSEYPQGYYPQCCITAVVVPGTEVSPVGAVGKRFIDNARIDGTIPQCAAYTKTAHFTISKSFFVCYN